MHWCESNGVDDLFGLAKNARLSEQVEAELSDARAECEHTGQAARRFRDFTYRTRARWSRARRVVGKAQQLPGKANPRFIVTNLDAQRRPPRRSTKPCTAPAERWRTASGNASCALGSPRWLS